MIGRSAVRNSWYGTMFGWAVPSRLGDETAEQVVRRLVHERGHARVEQRHGHPRAAAGLPRPINAAWIALHA